MKLCSTLCPLLLILLTTVVSGRSRQVSESDALAQLVLMMATGQSRDTANTATNSVKCIDRNNWSKDLTLSRLKAMITIFMGNTNNFGYVPSRTYIFVPDDNGCTRLQANKPYGHVYMSGSGEHAEDQMYDKCGLPEEFYLTSAPCPDCAVKLLDKYKYNVNYKPTIYIGRPYQGKGKTGHGNKNVNLICLAMLVQKGFEILPWDWHGFRDYLTSNDCKNAVNVMFTNQWKDVYKQRRDATLNTLINVYEMADEADESGKNMETLCRKALQG